MSERNKATCWKHTHSHTLCSWSVEIQHCRCLCVCVCSPADRIIGKRACFTFFSSQSRCSLSGKAHRHTRTHRPCVQGSEVSRGHRPAADSRRFDSQLFSVSSCVRFLFHQRSQPISFVHLFTWCPTCRTVSVSQQQFIHWLSLSVFVVLTCL